MKLSPLLVQFLYAHKELSLAGIGRFRLESPTGNEEFPDKISKTGLSAIISFTQDASVKEDAELVAFISFQSGKMKSLAAADLESYLELAKQFLNIGKPFFFEGIGTLTKNKSGKLDFSQSNLFSEKGKENTSLETDLTSTTEDSFKDYEEMFSPKKPKMPASKKIVLWLAILAGIGLTIWGGYLVYTKTKKPKPDSAGKSIPVQLKDTSASSKIDTTRTTVNINAEQTVLYKFVIEQANRLRALNRYNDLKKWGIDVRMETKDSINFKIFFLLAATPADTVRIRDSLNLLYGTMGKTFIER